MHRLGIYSPLRNWKEGDYPISPFLHLRVDFHCSSQGQILLSAQLMTDSEIDDIVGQLQQELEEFRKDAKAELRALRKKIGKK